MRLGVLLMDGCGDVWLIFHEEHDFNYNINFKSLPVVLSLKVLVRSAPNVRLPPRSPLSHSHTSYTLQWHQQTSWLH